MANYTVELHTMVEDWGYTLFPADHYYNFSNLTEDEMKDLEENFYKHYYYREIGMETPGRFLKYLGNTWYVLGQKYDKLFGIYKTEFTDDDIYTNNAVKSNSQANFLDSPQSQVNLPTEDEPGFLTNTTQANGSQTGLIGKSKYEVQRDYADKLRYIYFEFIKEFDNLFMQIF